ncbi:uncharacterized protein BYT42DRAFT_561600 [Radiomyces spectabilis]|uniref:uncharacterized protein n=1 Tax=Radiomyces spectabilis TaxID=64574 RepID=UPI00221E784B|nr:uncharacterized protein BYT42DRAFT_561600 [Radiomyces spectabilis]KAI8388882.1 hypothetical protein BYT42DRAFT_561600 [Radiomyces spectabilis]
MDDSDQPLTIGAAAWHARRAAWRTPSTTEAPTNFATESTAWLQDLPREAQLNIYQHLVNERRQLNQPLPLEIVVKVLVTGWKENGTWPNSTHGA